MDNNISFREAWGLDASPALIEELLADPKSDDNEWEMPLRSEEEEQISRQQDLQGRDDAMLSYVRNKIPNFAGVYVDNAHASRQVILTTEPMSDADLEEARSRVPDGQSVENRVVEFTLQELRAAEADVETRLASGDVPAVNGVGISNRKNAVEVFAADKDLDSVREALADLGDRVAFSSNSGDVNASCSNRDDCEQNPWRGGLHLTDPNDVSGGSCSAGFTVFASNGNKYLLTAGHCGDVDPWKHGPSSPRTTVGDTVRKYYADGGFSDSELIDITTWDDDHVIYKDNSNQTFDIDDSQINAQEEEGQHVCKTGYPTKNSCAEIVIEDYHSIETQCTVCHDLYHMTRTDIYQIHPEGGQRWRRVVPHLYRVRSRHHQPRRQQPRCLHLLAHFACARRSRDVVISGSPALCRGRQLDLLLGSGRLMAGPSGRPSHAKGIARC